MAHKSDDAISSEKMALPLSIISPIDIARVSRELEAYSEYYHQLELRKNKHSDIKQPKISQLLDNLIELNMLDLTDQNDRDNLRSFIEDIKTSAPVIHASFSVDPSVSFLEKIISYLRKEINQRLLLTIGLQPNIGAGLLLRTQNKYFDFSLKDRLFDASNDLIKLIKETN